MHKSFLKVFRVPVLLRSPAFCAELYICHLHCNWGWKSFIQSSSYGSVLKIMSLFCICVCILCSDIFNIASNILPDCGLIWTLTLFSLVPSRLKCWLHDLVDSFMISGLGFLPTVVSYLMISGWTVNEVIVHTSNMAYISNLGKRKNEDQFLAYLPHP